MSLDLTSIQRALTDEEAKLLDVLEDLGATEDGEIRDSDQFQHGFSDAAADTASRRAILQLAGKTAEELAAVRHALARIETARTARASIAAIRSVRNACSSARSAPNASTASAGRPNVPTCP